MDMEALAITITMVGVLYGGAYLVFKYIERLEND